MDSCAYSVHDFDRGESMSDRHASSSYPLRMPAELRERLEEIAGKNKRSLNAELVERLQATLEIDEAMKIGHLGADFSFAAAALVQLEEDLKEAQEENKSLQHMAYAEQMEQTLKSVKHHNETVELMLAALMAIAAGQPMDKQLEKRLQQIAQSVGGVKQDQDASGLSALDLLSKTLMIRLAAKDLAL